MVPGITEEGSGSGLLQGVIVRWWRGRHSDSLGICGIFRIDFSSLYCIPFVLSLEWKMSPEQVFSRRYCLPGLKNPDGRDFFSLAHLQVQKNLGWQLLAPAASCSVDGEPSTKYWNIMSVIELGILLPLSTWYVRGWGGGGFFHGCSKQLQN